MFNYELPEGWYWAKVEDVQAETKRATITGPFGSSIGSRFFVESGVPVIRGNNLKVGSEKFVDDGFVYITDEKAEELSGYKAIHDDLIFTAAGTLGQVGVIPRSAKFDYYIISNKQMRARFNKEIVDSQFAYYWFSSPKMVAYVNALDTGSTIPLINLGILRSLPLPIPPLSVQENISAILCSFDNKIALNRQINTTLESMAQALFKSWFVDFDPVIDNALAAGNEIPDALQKRAAARAARREALRQQTNETTNKTTGATDAASSEQALPETGLSDQRLPSEIQQLFPDRFVFTEDMGWVPEGWEVTKVAELMDLSYGKSLPATKRVEGTVPVYGSGGVSGYHNEHLVNGPGIIVGRKGTVGSLYWVEDDFFPIDTVFFVENKTELPLYWLYQTLGTLNIAGMGADSAVPGVNRNTVYACSVVVPTENVTKSYGALIDSLNSKKESLRLQERDLADLRDSLLPKLLSGQITIPDAGQQLAGVL
ncbi:restriction endonuclease subunit S [Thalassolituus sp. UBA2590]|uniref:restriction endonuclease subunit S n=1 Tax=Thalassolituus sp. UBA2590 TaxID=1947663 RepID=UPI0026480749|nr:restriction endonuclease subunit S [Thalassolituus sp. UBA2590]